MGLFILTAFLSALTSSIVESSSDLAKNFSEFVRDFTFLYLMNVERLIKPSGESEMRFLSFILFLRVFSEKKFSSIFCRVFNFPTIA